MAVVAVGFASAATVWIAVWTLASAGRSPHVERARSIAANTYFGWRGILRSAGVDGRLPAGHSLRVSVASAGVGAVLGFAAFGLGGMALGALAAGPAVRAVLRARRVRHAARLDACAADLALALASSLSAGHSVRGALLAADAGVPQPLSGQLRKLAVELALGRSTEDALADLRSRAASGRIDALAGAIALHRKSGADLARLLRELAQSFRARDAARADARAATAQARFTALIVAAIPPCSALGAEIVAPGSVSGAFAFAPTALLMVFAVALMAAGGLLCARVGRV